VGTRHPELSVAIIKEYQLTLKFPMEEEYPMLQETDFHDPLTGAFKEIPF
jgi:hypothetical protein